jgi:hypothetical protein
MKKWGKGWTCYGATISMRQRKFSRKRLLQAQGMLCTMGKYVPSPLSPLSQNISLLFSFFLGNKMRQRKLFRKRLLQAQGMLALW